MFNRKLKKQINEMQRTMNEANIRLIELKTMLLEIQKSTLGNRAAIIKDRSPVIEVIKEIEVNKARKKPRARIRPTVGGTRITEAEVDEMVVLFDRGLSYTAISGMTGRSGSAISNKIYQRKKALEEV